MASATHFEPDRRLVDELAVGLGDAVDDAAGGDGPDDVARGALVLAP